MEIKISLGECMFQLDSGGQVAHMETNPSHVSCLPTRF
jgi:hypothetical protein